jgi:hypothetical protein
MASELNHLRRVITFKPYKRLGKREGQVLSVNDYNFNKKGAFTYIIIYA